VLFAQAQVIAENELVLRAVREQQLAVVERLRDSTAIALAKGDNSVELARGIRMRAWLAHRDIVALVPKVIEKYKEQLPGPEESSTDHTDDLVPNCLKALLQMPDEPDERAVALARRQIEEQERDEHEALEAAAVDLVRLDRYQRRAWSRQKRALRDFLDIKLTRSGDDAAAAREEAACR